MNIQELMTINRYKIPLKIVVLDNNSLGMVRQWQQLFFKCRYSATILDDNPEFSKIAEVVGIKALKIQRPDEVEKAMRELAEYEGPMLVHALVDPRENVLPMVPPGGKISEPYLTAPYDENLEKVVKRGGSNE
jgi:acetolactate synthase-1/2/3 large subunit